ncbi:amino acid adenylation domain-containing protein [candidate division TA06 bacterium]|nr:amino acid adenylation domain-containing protein [candidate division TA06 bacterium]
MSKKAKVQKIYPLSPMQEGMLFHHLMDKHQDDYILQTTLDIEGQLNRELFEKSFNLLLERHEVLRSVFMHEKVQKPKQVVLEKRELKINYLDVSGRSAEETGNLVKNTEAGDRARGFDLTKDVLMRVTVLVKSPSSFTVIWSYHHILMDGWCFGVIVSELLETYRALVKGLSPALSAVPPNGRYLEWLDKQDREQALAYWKDYLGDYENVASLPQISSVQDQGFGEVNLVLDRSHTEMLSDLSLKHGTTVSTVFHTVWGLLFQRYCNLDDVVFGSVVSGRPAEVEGIEKMVGLFINTLPVRLQNSKGLKFSEALSSVGRSMIGAEKHSFVQLSEIQSLTEVKNNLFDHILVFENYPLDRSIKELNLGKEIGFRITGVSAQERTHYKLTVIVFPGPLMTVKLVYDRSAVGEDFIQKIGGHLDKVLEAVHADQEMPVDLVDMLTDDEKDRVLNLYNDTRAEYPSHMTIPELFEEQVKKTPHHIAVSYEGRHLTYHELNERANQLAGKLRDKGVKPGTVTAVMLDRSIEMIAGILAVMKAGGAFLPIDPECPEERLSYLLEDSGADIILSLGHLFRKIHFKGQAINLEDRELYSGSGLNRAPGCRPGDLLYIIYTSGTTGKPKAVMLEHRNMVNLVCFQYQKTNIDFTGNVMNFITVNFDVCYQEIFSTLLAGGRLFVIDDAKKRDIKRLMSFIGENNISVVFFPTSFLIFLTGEQEYLDLLPGCIRHIITAGEQLIVRESFREYLKRNELHLHNHYGPSETHVVSTYVISPGGPIPELPPIGLPVSNTRLYIMNRGLKLQPSGVAGELYISGDCVGRGYYGRDELTSEKYLPDPFYEGQTMYRTGDMVRRLPDGNIEYLGRMDNQVKIRGFRIELGEIESQLMAHPDIKDAVVLAKKDQLGGKFLCSYVVAPNSLHTDALREFLAKELPDYMIPSYFVHIEKMPYRPNGKVDWHRLPECQANLREEVEFVLPANVTEQRLADIWKEILSVGVVGVRDNFFELGGHSLKAMSLVSRINKEFSVDVPIRTVFKMPTVRELSDYIRKAKESIFTAIEPIPEKEHYLLSSAQTRIFVLNQFDKRNTNYNMPALLRIDGVLDRDRLEQAFVKLIARHESLRTSFEMIDGVPVQRVHRQSSFAIQYQEAEEREIDGIVDRFIKPFDLNLAPLIRVGLVKTADCQHFLLYDMHHIISDGMSLKILVKDMAAAYRGAELPPLRLQYRGYACWQQEALKSQEIKKQEEYWKNIFAGEIPVLDLTTDFTRPVVQSFEGGQLSFELEPELTFKLRELAAEEGATLYMALLAMWAWLLSKYTGQHDIVIGSPIAGRRHSDLEGIIGMFVNTLALRVRPERHMTFREFLGEVRQNMIGAYENQDCQFEELVEKLGVPRDLSRNPLFDTMFTLQKDSVDEAATGGLSIRPLPLKSGSSKFDLSLLGIERNDRIIFELEYCARLFRQDTVGRIRDHFLNIIKEAAADPDVKLCQVGMTSQGEREQILSRFNPGPSAPAGGSTLDRMFGEQARQTPENIALVCGERQVTYAELNGMASRLARRLLEKGAGPETIVGMVMDRSIGMIAGILGILKAGGAYLPLDPELPEERIVNILDDAGAAIVLTQEHLAAKVKCRCEKLIVDEQVLCTGESDVAGTAAGPQNLAYVIYTSGSTGKPKGVMVEHRSIANTIGWRIKHYGFSPADAVLQVPSYSFDSSVEDIFCPLLSGARLVLMDPGKRLDISYLEGIIDAQRITHFLITPGLYQTLLDGFRGRPGNLKFVTLAGEHFTEDLVKKHFKRYPGVRLFNEYGPTENSVCSTAYEFDKEDIRMLIGRPIENTKCYVLGEGDSLQPAGVKGELCLAGSGLARGYLNRPELTGQRFIPDPFAGGLMYRTGDLARWMPDGNLEFLGRADGQVKIRGFRIELGEIESQMTAAGDISKALVADRTDERGNKYLCGYYVSEKEFPAFELRERLAKILPEYMVPQYFIKLKEIPLTSRGKVDRRALPDPVPNQGQGTEYSGPRNDLEEKIAGIWEDIFGLEQIGINDNFFALGGHSLKAMQVVNRIRHELSLEMELHQIFQNPTVAGLARVLQEGESKACHNIEKLPLADYYQLSYNQKRLWIINQRDPGSPAYNMPGRVTLEHKVDPQHILATIEELTRRHEGLRTSFATVNEEPVQEISQENRVHFEVEDISGKPEKEVLRERIFEKFSCQTFDLSSSPLLRVKLIKLGDELYDLTFVMHHIISDGWSMEILQREFYQIYESIKQGREHGLEPLPVQYKDYAAWHNTMLESEKMQMALEHWRSVLSGNVPALELPRDNGPAANGESAGYRMVLKQETVHSLKEQAGASNASLFMVLLTGFNIWMSKLTGQERVLIGMASSGREHQNLKNVLGFFINTVVLSNKIEKDLTFTKLTGMVRNETLKALEYQSYPLELVVDKLKTGYPQISVFLNMLNLGQGDNGILDDTGSYHLKKVQDTKFELVFYFTEYANGVEVNCNYQKNVFKPETIQYICDQYQGLLDRIARDPGKKAHEYFEIKKKLIRK